MENFFDTGDDVMIGDYNNNQYNNNNQNFGNQGFEAFVGLQNPQQVNTNVGGPDLFSYGSMDEDPEEVQRKLERKNEEEIKRGKLVKKMNLEIELKQDLRNKANEWIENTNRLYQKNIASKREFHKTNETDFINNRNNIKQGKTNPWDVVIGNIDLRESDYKGSKDVSRMKNVIITRKGDFTTLKMK